MNFISRILGLTQKSTDLENQKANILNVGGNADKVKFDISVNKILLYSAQTNKTNYERD